MLLLLLLIATAAASIVFNVAVALLAEAYTICLGLLQLLLIYLYVRCCLYVCCRNKLASIFFLSCRVLTHSDDKFYQICRPKLDPKDSIHLEEDKIKVSWRSADIERWLQQQNGHAGFEQDEEDEEGMVVRWGFEFNFVFWETG